MTPNIKLVDRTIARGGTLNHVALSANDVNLLVASRSKYLRITESLGGMIYKYKGFPVRII